MLAGVPADAAAEGVAGDADVRGRAVQGGQAQRRGLGDDVAPAGAGADPRAARAGVDLDPVQARGLDQDRLLQGAERLGAVAAALRRHPQPVGGREADHGADVLGVVGDGDQRRPQVEAGVEGAALGVVAGVVGADRGAADQPPQGGRVGPANHRLGVHPLLLSVARRGEQLVDRVHQAQPPAELAGVAVAIEGAPAEAVTGQQQLERDRLGPVHGPRIRSGEPFAIEETPELGPQGWAGPP